MAEPMVIEISLDATKTKTGAKQAQSVAREIEDGFNRAISVISNYENHLIRIIALHKQIKPPPLIAPGRLPTGGNLPSERGAINTSKILDKLDNQLAKLQNRDSELRRINNLLSQPGAAKGIDAATQSLLRQQAVLIDTERNAQKLARTRQKELTSSNSPSFSNAGLIATSIAASLPVAGLYAAIKIGAEYERSMNILQVATKATAEQMRAADKLAVQLGSDLTLPAIAEV